MDIGPTYFSKGINTCSGTFVSLQTYFDDDSEYRLVEYAIVGTNDSIIYYIILNA